MQFKDICSIIEDIQLDQLSEGVKIVYATNSVLIPENESITITDTGLTLIGKYHIWSDELKLKVNSIDFNQSVDVLNLIKEVKQIRYAVEAQRDSDNSSKSQLIMIICMIILVVTIVKTCTTYKHVEETTPETNSDILKVTENVISLIDE